MNNLCVIFQYIIYKVNQIIKLIILGISVSSEHT